MKQHLYIVSWGGESKVMQAPSMEVLWKRIKQNYMKGMAVLIEDDKERRVFRR